MKKNEPDKVIICPYCRHKTKVHPDDQTRFIYEYCSYCGDIISGEILWSGEIDLDE